MRDAGFLSDDGEWAHCERPEHAGNLPLDDTTPPTYAHRIGGPCKCGQEHAPAPMHPNGTAQTYTRSLITSVESEIGQSLSPGLTLEALAEHKKLPVEFLRTDFTLSATRRNRSPAVRIPYHGADGRETAVNYRLALDGENKIRLEEGVEDISSTGSSGSPRVRAAGWVLLVEGESDTWTGWYHDLPVLGTPGKDTWRSVWATYLEGLEVVAWQEPDASSFVERIAKDRPDVRVIPAPEGVKDISDAHVQGLDVRELLVRLRDAAVPASELRAAQDEAELVEVRRRGGRHPRRD